MRLESLLSRLQDPIDVSGWEAHEDYSVYPVGSKPKRMLICPDPSPDDVLIPGHTYLFKTVTGWQRYQIWSEVLASALGRIAGLDVPPAFIAFDHDTGEPGVLVEFFYGYPGVKPKAQFTHAIDHLDRLVTDQKRGRPHALRTNLLLCRALGVPDRITWWGQVLAFDALIGNTDRHPQNWGFLIFRDDSHRPIYRLAPPFDNATSLGYELADSKLQEATEPARLERYINRGRHHCGWRMSNDGATPHLKLCEWYVTAHPGAGNAMRDVIRFDESVFHQVLEACTRCGGSLPFSEERAEFVHQLVVARTRKLSLLV